MINKKEIRKYVREVKKYLMCTIKEKNSISKNVMSAVLTYTEENNIQDIDEIYMHFGTPKAVAKQYLPDADLKAVKRKLIFRRILISVLSVIISAFAIYVTIMIIEQFVHTNTTIYVTPAIEIPLDDMEESSSYEKS